MGTLFSAHRSNAYSSPSQIVEEKTDSPSPRSLVIIPQELVEKSLDDIVNCIVEDEYLEEYYLNVEKDIKNLIRDFILGNRKSIKMLTTYMNSINIEPQRSVKRPKFLNVLELQTNKKNIDYQIKLPVITKGSYGEIHSVGHMGEEYIMKTPIFPENCEQREKDEITEQFLEEIFTTIILNCVCQKFFDIKPFTEVKKLYFLEKPQVLLEKLDKSALQFFSANEDLKMQAEFIRRLSEILKFLQKEINFVHRDLHSNNVMIKNIKYKGKGKDKKIVDYDIVIIDLGAVCVDLTKCCHLSKIEVSTGIYDQDFSSACSVGDKKCLELVEKKQCNNFSLDLRTFLYNLYVKRMLNKEIIKALNLTPQYGIDQTKNFYSHFVFEINENFLPEKIIKEMETLLR
jgi:hypothetical protein